MSRRIFCISLPAHYKLPVVIIFFSFFFFAENQPDAERVNTNNRIKTSDPHSKLQPETDSQSEVSLAGTADIIWEVEGRMVNLFFFLHIY